MDEIAYMYVRAIELLRDEAEAAWQAGNRGLWRAVVRVAARTCWEARRATGMPLAAVHEAAERHARKLLYSEA